MLFRKSKGLLCDWAFRELRWGGKIEDWKFKGQDRRGNSVTRTLWDLFCRSNWYIYILLLLLLFNYSWVGPSSLKKETLLKLWVFPVQALQTQYEFFFFFFHEHGYETNELYTILLPALKVKSIFFMDVKKILRYY